MGLDRSGRIHDRLHSYQAEASQGTLQLIYEYQSMMTALTGMDVSNASVYDGASGQPKRCLWPCGQIKRTNRVGVGGANGASELHPNHAQYRSQPKCVH
ncbi:MAG: hypothetical protein CM15mP120_06900 [Pseudomonadota bacterium]|nr:MAG: hypothetical protein CM15mP120_06900 [Pseudomonadota bacterium]